MIQTVDSRQTGRRLDARGQALDVMIEVKLSDEQSKAGIRPGDVPELMEAIRECAHLRPDGLMTMPPWSDDRRGVAAVISPPAGTGGADRAAGLSMGMSHDLEVAIEEGATHHARRHGSVRPPQKAVKVVILRAASAGQDRCRGLRGRAVHPPCVRLWRCE